MLAEGVRGSFFPIKFIKQEPIISGFAIATFIIGIIALTLYLNGPAASIDNHRALFWSTRALSLLTGMSLWGTIGAIIFCRKNHEVDAAPVVPVVVVVAEEPPPQVVPERHEEPPREEPAAPPAIPAPVVKPKPVLRTFMGSLPEDTSNVVLSFASFKGIVDFGSTSREGLRISESYIRNNQERFFHSSFKYTSWKEASRYYRLSIPGHQFQWTGGHLPLPERNDDDIRTRLAFGVRAHHFILNDETRPDLTMQARREITVNDLQPAHLDSHPVVLGNALCEAPPRGTLTASVHDSTLTYIGYTEALRSGGGGKHQYMALNCTYTHTLGPHTRAGWDNMLVIFDCYTLTIKTGSTTLLSTNAEKGAEWFGRILKRETVIFDMGHSSYTLNLIKEEQTAQST